MIAKLEQFVRRLADDQAFREIAVSEPERAVAMFGLIGPSARVPSSSARRALPRRTTPPIASGSRRNDAMIRKARGNG